MRLLKWIAFAGLGFLLYEMFEDLVLSDARPDDLHRALNQDQGRMNVTGPGRGRLEQTEDFTGASSPHRVGRGVVR
jgi:hypothetical protein